MKKIVKIIRQPRLLFIEEKQSRLPVKSRFRCVRICPSSRRNHRISLLRFRCVSTSWRSLIGSKRFIKTQYRNSIKNPSFPYQRVITYNDPSEKPVQCFPLSILSELTIPVSPLPTLMQFEIIGSCNGLLCIRDFQGRFQLWNPSTRISKILPEISNPFTALGFGWVESSDEYKLFVSVGNRDCKVYSSRTKSWKTSEHCADLASHFGRGIFAGGKLYWKKDKEIDIIFLDLKSEVFGRIEVPFDHEFCKKEHWAVGVLGGLLCVLCYIGPPSELVFGVWVMKEAWKKVATFANLAELLQPAPLVVGLNGEILVNGLSVVLVYDHQNNVFRGHLYYPHAYVESLVSPEDV